MADAALGSAAFGLSRLRSASRCHPSGFSVATLAHTNIQSYSLCHGYRTCASERPLAMSLVLRDKAQATSRIPRQRRPRCQRFSSSADHISLFHRSSATITASHARARTSGVGWRRSRLALGLCTCDFNGSKRGMTHGLAAVMPPHGRR